MEVYGDSPFNLFYRTRNDSMMALIDSALAQNPGSRMIVLTGAEHKHYFESALRRRADVSVVDLSEILPLPSVAIDPQIGEFLNEYDDRPYYEKGYPKDLNKYYHRKLIPLVHAPSMDAKPETIPPKSVSIAERFLEQWKSIRPDWMTSDSIQFETAWARFLSGRYEDAIASLDPLARKIELGDTLNPFIHSSVHRTLGLCYDCLGEREKAIAAYDEAERRIRQTMYASYSNELLRDFRQNPYKPARK
jgi:tetratricopeptide (TPR) repeat protein